MNAVATNHVDTGPAAALVALIQQWGKPTSTRMGTKGSSVALYKGQNSSESIEGRIRALGATVGVSALAPVRRGGPNSRQVITGVLAGASYLVKAHDIDQSECTIEVHFYPQDSESSGIDVQELFAVADAIFGGEAAAVNLLPTYLCNHLMHLDGAARTQLCAQILQRVADDLLTPK